MTSRSILFLSLCLFIFSACTDTSTFSVTENDGNASFRFSDKGHGDSINDEVKGNISFDENGIRVDLDIRDDELWSDTSQRYSSDMVELYFDLRPYRLRSNNFYEKGVFQVLLKPYFHASEPNSFSFYPTTYDTQIDEATFSSEKTENGYSVTFFMPADQLKEKAYLPVNGFRADIGVFNASPDTVRHFFWKGNDTNWKLPLNFGDVLFSKSEMQSGKPNILLIFTDQQTLKAMGAYGNPYVQTPNMDALAAHGVRFTNSYCTAPVCSPARSSIITGMMPHTTGVVYNGTPVNREVPNIGQILSSHGYHTTWAGKWHLPDSYPHSRGQDSVPGFRLANFLEPERMSGLGSVVDGPLADHVSLMLKEGIGEPFFLGVSFHNPHDICNVPSAPEKYPHPPNIDAAPPLPDNFEDDPEEPEFLKDCRERTYYGNELEKTRDYSENDWRNYIYWYYRFTERVDAEVGKIIEALEQGGYDENTLIIFTSDHGDGVASHRWAVKLSLYEEPAKVPMVITWLGKTPENEVREQLVSGVDIVPTILDYAGIETDHQFHGLSLRRAIEEPYYTLRDFVVSELAPDPRNPERQARMIRTDRYKYILYSYGARNEQLFDLKRDPGEKTNLAGRYGKRFVVSEHRDLLERWMEETGDDFEVTSLQ